jgi:hypothetical protein
LFDQAENVAKVEDITIISFKHAFSVLDALIELGEDDDFSLMGEKIR